MALLAFPGLLRAQSKEPLRIGMSLPLTGPYASAAAGTQRGAAVALDELNAAGGVLGRKIELLIRDDQLKPAVAAQRTQELIQKDSCRFIIGGLTHSLHAAISEQTIESKVLYVSLAPFDESRGRLNKNPLTFYEAPSSILTARAVGTFAAKNLGKTLSILHANYALGSQYAFFLADAVTKSGGTITGSFTSYPLGTPDFTAALTQIQTARPDVILAVAPGADGLTFLRQAVSLGLKKTTKLVMPLLALSDVKAGGSELFADVYGGASFYWEIQDELPEAKRFVTAFTKRFNAPPDISSGYAYSAVQEIARGLALAKSPNTEAVVTALHANPIYDHYKGKQWWRVCDNKSFPEVWIVRGRAASRVRGDWGYLDVVAKIAANEASDRRCEEEDEGRRR
jgi:branched-chain amino acid transport system substrate-binding protein